jgi:hypothetical protein
MRRNVRPAWRNEVPHPLRVILLAALLIAACHAPTTAAELDGEYAVYGHEMAEGRYTGKAAVAKSGDTYTVVWVFGEDIHRGTGILNGDTFSVIFFVRQSPVPGLAVYRIEEDGTLTGQFTVLGGKKVGAEMWKRVDH